MASNGSLDSPLSSLPSDEEDHERDWHSADETISAIGSPSVSTPRAMPPYKRRRTGASAYDHPTPLSTVGDAQMPAPPSPPGSISSDSSADVPNSPSFAHFAPTHPLSSSYAASQANPDDPESGDGVQVTRCLWSDCSEPEQGNMDRLVDHIQSEHIGQRQKKYSCEWEGCSRKGMTHASGYALRAHMRSHTREKPFYCQLPECDRSFTRSDALAKHMRTVHETEALRPSDPVPKGHSEATGRIAGGGAAGSNGSLKRIKLIVNNGDRPKSIVGELPPLPTDTLLDEHGEPRAIEMDSIPFSLPVPKRYYPSDVADILDEHERSLPPSQLYRLLTRQIHWAEQETVELTHDLDEVENNTEFYPKNDPTTSAQSLFDTKPEAIRHHSWLQIESLLQAILDEHQEQQRQAEEEEADEVDEAEEAEEADEVDETKTGKPEISNPESSAAEIGTETMLDEILDPPGHQVPKPIEITRG
jgi:Zinc finger, C2H2 type